MDEMVPATIFQREGRTMYMIETKRIFIEFIIKGGREVNASFLSITTTTTMRDDSSLLSELLYIEQKERDAIRGVSFF